MLRSLGKKLAVMAAVAVGVLLWAANRAEAGWPFWCCDPCYEPCAPAYRTSVQYAPAYRIPVQCAPAWDYAYRSCCFDGTLLRHLFGWLHCGGLQDWCCHRPYRVAWGDELAEEEDTDNVGQSAMSPMQKAGPVTPPPPRESLPPSVKKAPVVSPPPAITPKQQAAEPPPASSAPILPPPPSAQPPVTEAPNAAASPAITPKQNITTPPAADSDPMLPPPPPADLSAPADQAPPAPPKTSTGVSATGTAVLSVAVPADARVFVNNKATTTPGAERRYVSRGLVPGFTYTYEVRAEAERDGEVVSDTRVVKMRAGQTADLAFALDRASPDAVVTTLTLHVPEDATVRLAGRVTRTTGAVRQFTTTALAKDARWEHYRVEVAVERDGRPLVRETTLTLVGGQSREMQLDVRGERVAQQGPRTW